METLTDDVIYNHIASIRNKWKKLKLKDGESFPTYAKRMMYPLSKVEVIDRDRWNLNEITGETEKQLLHIHYSELIDYISKHHHRQHDILIVFECSNSKPYFANRVNQRNFYSKYNQFADFCCMSNCGIIPIEYSNLYPYRYDEWNHMKESKPIVTQYRIVNTNRFLNYVKTLGYKHVIVVMQWDFPQKLFDDLIEKDEANNGWLHIVTTDEFRHNLYESRSGQFSNKGIMISRTMNLPETRRAIECELIKYIPESDKQKFNDLISILKIEDNSYAKNKMLYDWKVKTLNEPIKCVSSIDSNYTYALDKSNINNYHQFIQSFLNRELNLDKDNLHENRIYFTTLDLLLDFYKGNTINEINIDNEYHVMQEALNNALTDHPNIIKIYDYMFFHKEILSKMKEHQLYVQMKRDGYLPYTYKR